ncbi:MAG: AAA family ATPase [Pseudomonadota bacterium]
MPKARDIIIIAGLSGVGKTYVINHLLQQFGTNYKNFSAGSLIKKRISSLAYDDLCKLDKNSVLQNQQLLVEQFNEELLETDKNFTILFDAHMVIDNHKEVIEIPYEIFKQLLPTKIIFLFDEPEKIITRRKNDESRKRHIRTTQEIKEQQDHSAMLAKKYARLLSIPLIEIKVSDTELLKIIRGLC